jgi:hypothetical protein
MFIVDFSLFILKNILIKYYSIALTYWDFWTPKQVPPLPYHRLDPILKITSDIHTTRTNNSDPSTHSAWPMSNIWHDDHHLSYTLCTASRTRLSESPPSAKHSFSESSAGCSTYKHSPNKGRPKFLFSDLLSSSFFFLTLIEFHFFKKCFNLNTPTYILNPKLSSEIQSLISRYLSSPSCSPCSQLHSRLPVSLAIRLCTISVKGSIDRRQDSWYK